MKRVARREVLRYGSEDICVGILVQLGVRFSCLGQWHPIRFHVFSLSSIPSLSRHWTDTLTNVETRATRTSASASRLRVIGIAEDLWRECRWFITRRGKCRLSTWNFPRLLPIAAFSGARTSYWTSFTQRGLRVRYCRSDRWLHRPRWLQCLYQFKML